MTALEWTIIWSILVLAFNGGIAWGVVRAVTPKVEKLENSLMEVGKQVGNVATSLKGIEVEQKVRHEENQRRLERLEEWVDEQK